MSRDGVRRTGEFVVQVLSHSLLHEMLLGLRARLQVLLL